MAFLYKSYFPILLGLTTLVWRSVECATIDAGTPGSAPAPPPPPIPPPPGGPPPGGPPPGGPPPGFFPPPGPPPVPGSFPTGTVTTYYDYVVYEMSFKMWYFFMFVSFLMVLFSILECVYYSKVNYVAIPPDYVYDYLVKRSVRQEYSFWTPRAPPSPRAQKRILRSIGEDSDFSDDYEDE